jgi:hypothetical protein
MRVWTNIETCLSPQHGRTHLIEKHEPARCAALRRRKDAANLEPAAEIAGPRNDDRPQMASSWFTPLFRSDFEMF